MPGSCLSSKGLAQDQGRCDRDGRGAHADVAGQESGRSRWPMLRSRCDSLSRRSKRAKRRCAFARSGGGAADAVEITRAVLTPGRAEAVALYGDTTGACRREARRSLVDARRRGRARAVGLVDRARRTRRAASSSSSNTPTAAPSSSPAGSCRCCRFVIWRATFISRCRPTSTPR